MADIDRPEQEAYARCRAKYPTVDLPIEEFLARARTSGVEFARLCHEDLFLATACAGGDRIAWEYFADDYLPLLHRLAARACRQLQESEDLAQELAANLIADTSKIAGYSGRGSLAGWLRAAVAHAAIDRFRKKRREVPFEETDEPEQARVTGGGLTDGGAEAPDARWGPVLLDLLREQLRALAARDRLILALYYLHDASLKDVGRHFGVHEATASRRLDGLRNDIKKRVERELRTRYGLRPSEAGSLWKWVAEREDLSFRDVLAVEPATRRPAAGPGCAVQKQGIGTGSVEPDP